MSEGPHQLLARAVVLMSERLMRPIDYIEIGVCIGNSARAVLETGRVRRYTGIDNWSQSWDGNKHLGERDVRQRLNGHPVELITGDSMVRMPLISGRKAQYDIGFVDGDHSDAGCRSDMENLWPMIRENGIMFVDDIRNVNHTLEPVVEDFARTNGLSSVYYSDHQGVLALCRT
jgi:predicted O-methyltransferase YrrM